MEEKKPKDGAGEWRNEEAGREEEGRVEEERRSQPESEPAESNAAKRLRLLGEEPEKEVSEEPVKRTAGSWIGNFWYHHKVKVLMIAFFTVAIGIGILQFVGQSNPDVLILYSGPQYITANQNQAFCSAVRELMTEDYNGDGEKKVRLTDIVYWTQNQVEEAADKMGDDFQLDVMENSRLAEKFSYEVFGGDAIICILAEDQYRQVMQSGGFLPLAEIFDGQEVEGAIDECGIRFSETKFYQFYDACHIFPKDAVLALRRVSTLSAITGRRKAEKVHAYHRELFRRLSTFEFPDGYVPDPTEETEKP